jgi:hypothetical protein
MSKINSLLSQRLKQKFSKMTELATLSSEGQLSSFSGVFRVSELSSVEKEHLEAILNTYKEETQEISADFRDLSNITSEVKAINNQAAILHGERIKHAQEILKKYRDGAFSAWLLATYGNRQTPYNFLQYYELYQQLPRTLHPKLDEMPRQAVYTLASRQAPLEKKEEVIKSYKGEPKNELLSLIRKMFPLGLHDKRAEDVAAQAISSLKRILKLFEDSRFKPDPKQKQTLENQLRELLDLL